MSQWNVITTYYHYMIHTLTCTYLNVVGLSFQSNAGSNDTLSGHVSCHVTKLLPKDVPTHELGIVDGMRGTRL